MSELVLYLVGLNLDLESESPDRWEFTGVFSDFDKAEKACTKPGHFVAPVPLNEVAPEESTSFPTSSYPLLEAS